MNKQTRYSGLGWAKAFGILVVFAFLCVLAPTMPAGMNSISAQPILVKLAETQPDASVSVIVQKTTSDSSIEDAVARLGGMVTQDLSIINAFAAEITAKNAVELAKVGGVRWVSLDAPVVQTGCNYPCINTASLKSVYPQAVSASRAWNLKSYLQGQGIGVAIVDTGINAIHPDLLDEKGASRVVASVKVNAGTANTDDYFGHGTHIAGIIGGNGKASGGAYIGISPKVNLVNVKISDDQGNTRESDAVAGLQWVYQNRDKYNIRVVNLSLNATMNQPYHTSPIDAACEVLWFNKIVVVVAAGNTGWNSLHPPANDPFVITVGATDDVGTASIDDDRLAFYSTFGRTVDGIAKPDLVAPGQNIVSLLSRPNAVLATAHPDHRVSGFAGSERYYRMSGTSMSAPVVAGAAALVLQSNPNLTPDQVKFRLKATTMPLVLGSNDFSKVVAEGLLNYISGSGQVNVFAAVTGKTTQSANTGMAISKMLTPGAGSAQWTSLNWDSLNWDSLNWDSLNWDSLNWDSLNWDSVYWGK